MKKHLMLRLDAFLLPKLFVIERNYYASLKYIIRSAHKRLYQESRSITLYVKEKSVSNILQNRLIYML